MTVGQDRGFIEGGSATARRWELTMTGRRAALTNRRLGTAINSHIDRADLARLTSQGHDAI
jgi:hypothetical protein